MTARPRVGLLGGTFDPIHLGHLAAARAAQHALDLDSVRLIVSARPPHRPDSPRASEYHRLEMLRLAVADEAAAGGARLEVSDLELKRAGPSFTFDTLQTLQAEGLTTLQIVFITGADAFAEIETWHRYPDVLDAAHFAVLARPGTTLASLQQRLPALASRMIEPDAFDRATTSRIVLIDADTPDVSSTVIRARAGCGERLDGLVTSSVAAYIAQNHLYRTAPLAPIATEAPRS
jgi:nicotinate-nucleotide adenylyltransferase